MKLSYNTIYLGLLLHYCLIHSHLIYIRTKDGYVTFFLKANTCRKLMFKIVSSDNTSSHFLGHCQSWLTCRCSETAECSQESLSKRLRFHPTFFKKDNYQDLLGLYFHQFNIVLGLSHFRKTKKTPCNSDFPFEGTRFLNDSPIPAINSSILVQL